MKRILLFIVTNLAVVLVLSVVLRLLGLDRAMTAETGMNLGSLLVFSAVVGFTGAIISLLMSKSMAKWSTGAHVIEQPANDAEVWIVETVRKLATKAGVGMPEVAIYDGAPNAFATGAFRNSALVAVSTGLLQSMNKEEVEAVLGHELAHVANGDMVTLTLIQGVVNTFVVFFARIIGSIVDKTVFRTERGNGPGLFHHRDRRADRARHPRVYDRCLVLAPSRVSRRRRQRSVPRQPLADGQRAAPAGRPRAGRATAIDGRIRYYRQGGHHVAVRDAPADRGADRRAAAGERVSGKQGPRAEGRGMRAIANRARRPTARASHVTAGAEAERVSGEQGERASGEQGPR